MVKTETNIKELKINYLTEQQYADAMEQGLINENEIYMTPAEDIDLSSYATKEYSEKLGIKDIEVETVEELLALPDGYYNLLSSLDIEEKRDTDYNVRGISYDTYVSTIFGLIQTQSYKDSLSRLVGGFPLGTVTCYTTSLIFTFYEDGSISVYPNVQFGAGPNANPSSFSLTGEEGEEGQILQRTDWGAMWTDRELIIIPEFDTAHENVIGANYTYKQVKAAYDLGIPIKLFVDNQFLNLSAYYAGSGTFEFKSSANLQTTYNGSFWSEIFSLYNTNNWHYLYKDIVVSDLIDEKMGDIDAVLAAILGE